MAAGVVLLGLADCHRGSPAVQGLRARAIAEIKNGLQRPRTRRYPFAAEAYARALRFLRTAGNQQLKRPTVFLVLLGEGTGPNRHWLWVRIWMIDRFIDGCANFDGLSVASRREHRSIRVPIPPPVVGAWAGQRGVLFQRLVFALPLNSIVAKNLPVGTAAAAQLWGCRDPIRLARQLATPLPGPSVDLTLHGKKASGAIRPIWQIRGRFFIWNPRLGKFLH